jgi:histidinol-phosphate aminotransferase
LIGNGSNELILALVIAVCGRGDSVLTVKPGFSVHKRAAELLSTRLIEVPLRENFLFDVPALIREAEQARLVFLASPNNPTGTALEAEDIRKIAEKTAGLLAVDEAYYEFCGRTALPLIAKRENVVVLRTFSKAWRLAGARLGYMLGRPDFVQQAAKARLPFSVGLFAQAAAEVMLDHRERVERSARDIITERERVFQELAKMAGIVPVPSLANFILFEAQGRSASDLFRRLREKGILVRVFDDPLLEKHVRVTVGEAGENDIFLSALREIMEEPEP